MSRTDGERVSLYSVLTLTLLAAGLRFAFIFQPMMHDEAVNYMYFASHPLSFGLSHYPYPNNHLLNTLLVHFTTRLMGNSPFVIRLPAFVAGILLIPATYFLIRELYNRDAAILAAALVVPSSQLIAYSADARGFTIQALIFLLIIIISIRVMRKDNLAWWGAFAVLSALGFYTIPTMLYFFSAVVLWLLLSAVFKDIDGRRWVFITKLTAACAATAVLVLLMYLPVIHTSGLASITSNTWVKSLSSSSFWKGLGPAAKDYWQAWNKDIPLPVSILLLMGVISSMLFHKRISKIRVNLIYPVLASCLFLVSFQRVLPPARVWLPLLPLYLGFSAAGLFYIGSRLWAYVRERRPAVQAVRKTFPVFAVAVAVILGILVLISQSPYQPQDQVRLRDAESIALTLKRELRPGDIIYVEPNVRKPLEYYFIRNRIPLKYLYMWPEDLHKKFIGLKRAFLIDASKEGHVYGIQQALNASNLNPSRTYNVRELVGLPHSSIDLVVNPSFSES